MQNAENKTDQKSPLLLMTATISPPAKMPGVYRADPSVRLQDYYQALKFYLKLPNFCINRILFLENSRSDLSRLRQLVDQENTGKQVNFISVSDDYDPRLGKAHGEFKMIDEGLDQYHFSDTDVLWKVTGRLVVSNLQQLVETSPEDFDLYCDLRSIPGIGDFLGGNHWMDLRVFSCSGTGYNRFFKNRYREFGSCPCPEKYIFQDVIKYLNEGNGKIFPRFSSQPITYGYSGHSARSYQSKSDKMKEILRKLTRSTMPWIWI